MGIRHSLPNQDRVKYGVLRLAGADFAEDAIPGDSPAPGGERKIERVREPQKEIGIYRSPSPVAAVRSTAPSALQRLLLPAICQCGGEKGAPVRDSSSPCAVQNQCVCVSHKMGSGWRAKRECATRSVSRGESDSVGVWRLASW